MVDLRPEIKRHLSCCGVTLRVRYTPQRLPRGEAEHLAAAYLDKLAKEHKCVEEDLELAAAGPGQPG